MPPDYIDRRRAPRRTPQLEESLSHVKLRAGRELTVVNISSSGALVEGLTRLLPGTRADLHVITRQGRVLVRTRIVRSLVWRLEPDVVCYRTGLSFETAVDVEAAHVSSERESNGPALSESNGPALSESNGPALSERSSHRERDERESNGYPVPAEIGSNDEGPGIRYPSAEVANRV